MFKKWPEEAHRIVLALYSVSSRQNLQTNMINGQNTELEPTSSTQGNNINCKAQKHIWMKLCVIDIGLSSQLGCV